MNRKLIAALATTFVLALAVPVSAQDLASQIVGVWKLKSFETTEVESKNVIKPYGDKPALLPIQQGWNFYWHRPEFRSQATGSGRSNGCRTHRAFQVDGLYDRHLQSGGCESDHRSRRVPHPAADRREADTACRYQGRYNGLNIAHSQEPPVRQGYLLHSDAAARRVAAEALETEPHKGGARGSAVSSAGQARYMSLTPPRSTRRGIDLGGEAVVDAQRLGERCQELVLLVGVEIDGDAAAAAIIVRM